MLIYVLCFLHQGFVAAITPFNFTAINGNLSGTPAIVGNVMLWKPASPAILAAHLVQKIFQEAGLPDGNNKPVLLYFCNSNWYLKGAPWISNIK